MVVWSINSSARKLRLVNGLMSIQCRKSHLRWT
jgi:hypothetical protein